MKRHYNDFLPIKIGGRNAINGGKEKLNALLDKCYEYGGYFYNVEYMFEISSINNDLNASKYNFYCENFCPYECSENEDRPQIRTTESGLDFIAFIAWTGCSDWQTNVLFFIYWDGKKYRAYIPMHGNPINTINKEAFGEDEDIDIEYAEKYGYDKYDIVECSHGECSWEGKYDYDVCLEEFQTRVVVDGNVHQPKIEQFNLKNLNNYEND